MKKLFLTTALILISSVTFANEVPSEKISSFLNDQKEIQKLIKKQSKKHACSEWEVTDVKNKTDLIEAQIDLQQCLDSNTCEDPKFISKLGLTLVKSTLKLFKDDTTQIIYLKSECSSEVNKKGVSVIVGSDSNEALSLVYSGKY